MDTEQRENLDEEVITPAAAEVEEHAPVEMTPEDAEAEEEFSIKEDEWRKKLESEVERWKSSVSVIKAGTENTDQTERDISHLRDDEHPLRDVRLFHAFQQVEKSDSLFYKKQFEHLVTEIMDELPNKYEDPTFCLARVLDALHKKSTAEMKEAA